MENVKVLTVISSQVGNNLEGSTKLVLTTMEIGQISIRLDQQVIALLRSELEKAENLLKK